MAPVEDRQGPLGGEFRCQPVIEDHTFGDNDLCRGVRFYKSNLYTAVLVKFEMDLRQGYEQCPVDNPLPSQGLAQLVEGGEDWLISIRGVYVLVSKLPLYSYDARYKAIAFEVPVPIEIRQQGNSQPSTALYQA